MSFSVTNRDMVALERAALDGLLEALDVRLSGAESTELDRLLRAKSEAERLAAEGWRLYGRSFLVNTRVSEMIAFSEKARRIDPNCIAARILRGCMLRDLALFSRSPMEAWPEAEREFSAILEIDPTDRAALNQRGGAWAVRGWDWEWVDRHINQEMLWQPEPIRAFLRSYQLRAHGYLEASKQPLAVVEAENPTSFGVLLHCAYAQWTYRDYDKGLQFARRARELHPDAAWPDFLIALLSAEQGDGAEALRAIDRAEQQTQFQFLTALRGYVYARMGRSDRAREVLESLFAERFDQPYVQPYPIARVYAALGEPEQALDWLEKAEADRSEFLVLPDGGGLRTDPAWDDLQDHPRFESLLKKVGLHVWPVPIHPLEP
jgi:tetratricopeptide (TPR) repeat protein